MLNFVENLERKDLNPLEEARALARLYPEGVSLRVAAAEFKRPTGWVHDRQRLLTLPEEVQQFAAAGLLAMCNVKVLAALPPEEQITAARKIVHVKQEHGKTASMRHLDPSCRRKFGYRKSKAEINRMVAKMLGRGITGLAPRMGAWCAGYITRRGNRAGYSGSRSNFGRRLLIQPVEPHMTTLADKLRSEPGIDVRRLPPGTRLFIETENHVYEMKVVLASAGLLEITSSDPALHLPTVGQYLGGQFPPDCTVEGWIGKGLLMSIRFRNGSTRQPRHVREVEGATWHRPCFDGQGLPACCP